MAVHGLFDDVVLASSVEAEPLPMLWRERIPAASLSVIAGQPGAGKSTLECLIAAELSREGLRGVICNVEDDLNSVTRPRLEAHGADLDLVSLVPHHNAPNIPRDLDQLGILLRRLGASYLILDPIRQHFAPQRLLDDGVTLRKLSQVARGTRCAIIGIHHTTKEGVVAGSNSGLIGTARAVFVHGFDPEDEDRRALGCHKINGVDFPPGLVLEQSTVELPSEKGMVETGVLKIVGEVNADGEAVKRKGRRNTGRDDACAKWLSLFLAAGVDCSRMTREVRTEGTAAGFGWATLQRVGVTMRVEKVRIGFGGDGFWSWRLPDDHPLREQHAEETPVG